MTIYEKFKNATEEEMAELLTALACGLLGDVTDPVEIREIGRAMLKMLQDETL